MNKLIFGALLGICATGAFAQVAGQQVCAAAGQGGATNVSGSTNGNLFVRVAFTATCSTNTVVVYSDDGTKVWAAGASTKGQSGFGGSTNGGSVSNVGLCNANKACGTAAATLAYVGAAPLTAAAAMGNTN